MWHHVIVVVAVGAAALIFGASGDESEAEAQQQQQEQIRIVETQSEDARRISRAIVILGSCSVVCSLIWGGTIITVARYRRKNRCHD